MADIIEVVKKAAIQAVNAMKLVDFKFGTVISVNPLQINIEQKLTLEAPQLILSQSVIDYSVNLKFDSSTEAALNVSLAHTHNYSGDVDEYSGNVDNFTGAVDNFTGNTGNNSAGTVDPHNHPNVHNHNYTHNHAYKHKHSYKFTTDKGTNQNVNLTHSHGFSGEKTVTIRNGLKEGEKVILVSIMQGQKYLVLDRYEEATVT